MSEEFSPEDSYTIDSIDTLKVISDPFRLRILEQMGPEPITVKRIAEGLNLSPKKLYYHVNMLEEHGLIRVVDTQVVSGIIEKWYQVRAHSFVVDRSLLTVVDDAGEGHATFKQLIASIFKVAEEEISGALQAGLIPPDDREKARRTMYLCQTKLHMTEEARMEFVERLDALIKEFDQEKENPDAQIYGLTIVSSPIAAPGDNDTNGETEDEQ